MQVTIGGGGACGSARDDVRVIHSLVGAAMYVSELPKLETPTKLSVNRRKSQYETRYDPTTATLWGWYDPSGNPCFNLGLLNDIRRHDQALQDNKGRIQHDGQS